MRAHLFATLPTRRPQRPFSSLRTARHRVSFLRSLERPSAREAANARARRLVSQSINDTKTVAYKPGGDWREVSARYWLLEC